MGGLQFGLTVGLISAVLRSSSIFSRVKLLTPMLLILPTLTSFSNSFHVSAVGTSARRNLLVTGSIGVRVSLVWANATGQCILLVREYSEDVQRWTYEIKIKIVCLKVFQRLVKRLFDVLGVMMGVPQLACDLIGISSIWADLQACYNSRISGLVGRRTFSNRFQLHSRSNSMQQRQYGGIQHGEQPRRHFQPHEVWKAILLVLLIPTHR